MPSYDYDMIAIGAGAGGFVSSKVAAGFGKKVAMIEKNRLGGECTNAGCIPSKALLKAAAAAHQAKHLHTYGLELNNGSVSARNVMQYVRGAVKKVYDSHPAPVFEKAGITVLFGSPRFLDAHHIELGGRTISSRYFMLCTGSSAFVPPLEGLSTVPFFTNENIFEIETLPPSLIVLGGGPIGIELASAYNRLGVATTVVEMGDRILARDDRELAELLAKQLAAEGLQILTSTRALKAVRAGQEIALTVETRQKQQEELKASALLIASGRKPNVEGLDLEKAGVQYGPKGVVTDHHLRTTAPNIFACGDVVGPYQFSHMTEYQAVTATRNMFLPFKKKVSYDLVAWCTFTDPELAHAGMTEEEARERYGDKVSVYRMGYGEMDRGRTDSTEAGLAKYIIAPDGKLLGAHILGERAGDIIHEAQVLRHLNLPFSAIAQMIHIYPTYTDVVRQPAKRYYIDRLRNNPFVKLAAKILGKRS
ncbi:MAG: FAD-dependent oxidoreductase [Nitrospirota bacterium]|nr:FAD-dependent oxidoreductase [Nitrospirota bacterium]